MSEQQYCKPDPSVLGEDTVNAACYGRGGCRNQLQFGILRASARGDGNDDGVSKQRLARLDEFFDRDIAGKRVPGAVVAIARDSNGSLQGVRTSIHKEERRCDIRIRVYDQTDAGGSWVYADGKGSPASAGQASRFRNSKNMKVGCGSLTFDKIRSAEFSDLRSRSSSQHIRPQLWRALA
ncbi:hypothetical protein ACE103_07750 [Bradyrhizobium sp. ma5]|uniref:hypothetical protein n=1 Tax=Bradyrhizobium sp. ma5 TaxID=3344828 RepID=UPI0035D409F1